MMQNQWRTLLYAFECGINFVDTAQMYGRGRSESVVGEALRQWRGERIYVATKVQPTVWPGPNDANPEMRGRYPRWHLRKEVEASLKRLQGRAHRSAAAALLDRRGHAANWTGSKR